MLDLYQELMDGNVRTLSILSVEQKFQIFANKSWTGMLGLWQEVMDGNVSSLSRSDGHECQLSANKSWTGMLDLCQELMVGNGKGKGKIYLTSVGTHTLMIINVPEHKSTININKLCTSF